VRRFVVIVCAGVALFWCYLSQSRAYGVNSDAAAQALQAWDMLHGNLLLSGWSLSDVSFYTTELPEYMLVEVVRGLSPDVVHVCAALTYTLLVLAAAFAARGGATGWRGLMRALLAGGIMVAPQLTPGSQVLLLQPDHTGTGVPLLVLFLLLDRLPPRWYVPVLMFAGLTWVQIADSMATYAAAAPLVLVCGTRVLAGMLRRETRFAWFDVWLALAGAGSALAAAPILNLIRAGGGFWVHQVPDSLAPPSALPGHAWTLVRDVLVLFGAGVFDAPGGLAMAIAVVHLFGAALAVWAVCAGLRRFAALGRVPQVILTGLLIVLVAGLFSTLMVGIGGAHEVAIVLPYAAVLTGRLLGDRLAAMRAPLPARSLALARSLAVLAVVGVCYLAALGYGATRPSVQPQNQALGTWLEARGLTSGLAGYWQADEVRLDTGGEVALAPLGDGTLADNWESKHEWFTTTANFVVTVSSPAAEALKARPAAVIAMFGDPARVYRFGRYTIMVWRENVLPYLNSR
jgi:hypothetical protein